MHLVLMHVAKNVLPPAILAELEQHDLTVITEPGHVQNYANTVDVVEISSIRDVTAAGDAFRTILRRRPVDRLLHPFELGQSVAGYLRSVYGIPGMDFETANLFTNKYAMKRAYQTAGIPTAQALIAYSAEDIGDAASRIGWPVIVKPMLGGGSMDVHRLDDAEALNRLLVAPEYASVRGLAVPFVVEPFVEVLAEYHCDGIVTDGIVIFSEAAQYLAPLFDCPAHLNGSSFLADDDAVRSHLLRLHNQAVTALGLRDGVTHMEFFRTPQGILAGEIACRPAGGAIPEAILLGYDVDIWHAQLQTMLGEAPYVRKQSTSGTLVNYHLPVGPGRVARLTTADDLSAIDGVIAVRMLKSVGDVIPDAYNSSYASGYVFIGVDDPAEIDDAVRRVVDKFTIELEPQGSQALR